MLAVDMIGIIATVFLIGLRYPLQACAAVFVHEFGKFFLLLSVCGQVSALTAGGIFAVTPANMHGWEEAVYAWGGSLANYSVACLAGGIAYEKTGDLLKPWTKLRCPTGTIQLRLALFSLLYAGVEFFSNI